MRRRRMKVWLLALAAAVLGVVVALSQTGDASGSTIVAEEQPTAANQPTEE